MIAQSHSTEPNYERWVFPGGYSAHATRGDCYYDHERARRAVQFFAVFLRHVKGELAGQPLKLEEWQAAIIATIYGWRRADGKRRFRTVYLQVPRKAGKSTICSGIALLELYASAEQGGEIYSCASDREQAGIVFEIAKTQVMQCKQFSSRSKVYRNSIVNYDPKTSMPIASYKALSAVAASKHGYNPSTVIFDELHAQPNRDLWDVMKTGMGARSQPLLVAITTAGHDRNSICWEQYQLACRVRDNTQPLQELLPVIYEATASDDWKSPETWKKAQPNLDVSVPISFYESECKEATANPAYENTFRRLYLNQWTQQDVRWLSLDKWHACGASESPVVPGDQCYVGCDLSSTTDLTAVVAAFPRDDGTIWLEPHFFIPEESARRRGKRDRVPYELWASQGYMTLTPGDAVDYEYVRKHLLDLHEKYWIQQIRFDPWNATQIATQLLADGLPVEYMRQGFASISGPAKEFETAIMRGELRHTKNPVLDWCAGNVAAEVDAAGNIKPSKKKSTERIDGVVASIMAIAGLVSQAQRQQWYYESNKLEMG